MRCGDVPAALTTIAHASRSALNPTRAQADLIGRHLGGSRLCYNALLRLVTVNWDENRARKEAGAMVPREDNPGVSHFDLLYLWSATRDDLAHWWHEQRVSTYVEVTEMPTPSGQRVARIPSLTTTALRGSLTSLPNSHLVQLRASYQIVGQLIDVHEARLLVPGD